MRTDIIWMIAGGVLGAAAGWLYWKYVGCATGTCPITARPVSSSLYGALIGVLLASSVVPPPSSRQQKQQQQQQQTKENDRNA